MSVRGERTGRVLLAVGAPSATAKPRFQALGVLLSTIGTSLVVLTVIVTVGGGVLLTILGARVSSGNETAVALAIAAVFAGLMSVGTTTLTLLFATCFLMLGEQLRRGGIGSSARLRRGVLPRGSYLSAFRPIGTGWHALWAVASVALALVLLLVPIVGDVTRGRQARRPGGGWPPTTGRPANRSVLPSPSCEESVLVLGGARRCSEVLALVGILNAWQSGKSLYSLESVSEMVRRSDRAKQGVPAVPR